MSAEKKTDFYVSIIHSLNAPLKREQGCEEVSAEKPDAMWSISHLLNVLPR